MCWASLQYLYHLYVCMYVSKFWPWEIIRVLEQLFEEHFTNVLSHLEDYYKFLLILENKAEPLFFGNSSSYCSGIVDTLRILFDFVGDLFLSFPKKTFQPQSYLTSRSGNSEFGSKVLRGVIGFLRKNKKCPLILYIFFWTSQCYSRVLCCTA